MLRLGRGCFAPYHHLLHRNAHCVKGLYLLYSKNIMNTRPMRRGCASGNKQMRNTTKPRQKALDRKPKDTA